MVWGYGDQGGWKTRTNQLGISREERKRKSQLINIEILDLEHMFCYNVYA